MNWKRYILYTFYNLIIFFLSLSLKAFQQYQDSRFSTILIEDFGVTDTLDPAAVSYSNTYTTLTTITCNVEADEVHTQLMAGFESACSERIRPFDDVDSEDEEVSEGL